MLLVCLIWLKIFPIGRTVPSDSTLRLSCIHGESSMFLDRYAGELLPAQIRPVSADVLRAQPASGVRLIGAIFHQGLSTGRETLATVFVILGIIAFQMGQPEKALQDAEAAWRSGFGKGCQILKRCRRETQS